MRKAARTAVVVFAALTLAGCGAKVVSGSPSAAQPGAGQPTTSASRPSTGGDPAEKAAVERVFKEYYQALLTRDFPKACGYNAPETIQKLLETVRSKGLTAADCPEALQKIYAIPGTGDLADKIATTAQVRSVRVSGETATITWSAELNGTQTVTNSMRKIDGDWKLVDTD